MRDFLRSLFCTAFLLTVTACSDGAYEVPVKEHVVPTVKHRITAIGVPDPKHDIAALIAQSTVGADAQLTGTWQGRLDYYNDNKLTEYKFTLDFKQDNDRLEIIVIDGVTTGDRFEQVVLAPPKLDYHYLGFFWTPEEGDNIPFYAELVIIDANTIKGHYKHLLDEVGGVQYFSRYDFTLWRVEPE